MPSDRHLRVFIVVVYWETVADH